MNYNYSRTFHQPNQEGYYLKTSTARDALLELFNSIKYEDCFGLFRSEFIQSSYQLERDLKTADNQQIKYSRIFQQLYVNTKMIDSIRSRLVENIKKNLKENPTSVQASYIKEILKLAIEPFHDFLAAEWLPNHKLEEHDVVTFVLKKFIDAAVAANSETRVTFLSLHNSSTELQAILNETKKQVLAALMIYDKYFEKKHAEFKGNVEKVIDDAQIFHHVCNALNECELFTVDTSDLNVVNRKIQLSTVLLATTAIIGGGILFSMAAAKNNYF